VPYFVSTKDRVSDGAILLRKIESWIVFKHPQRLTNNHRISIQPKMSSPCDSTCVSVSETSVVDVDPSQYVSNLPVSSHLEFERPQGLSPFKSRIDLLNSLLSENPPQEVVVWLDAQVDLVGTKIAAAQQQCHERNARLLAERVIHKFQKWGPVRFGATERCQADFYDGSARIDGPDNAITLDPSFEAQVRELAETSGLDATQILTNLHIGRTCAARFQEFIHVTIPDLPDLIDSSSDDDTDEHQESDNESDSDE